MGRLEGKTALVTGASRGIGRAIALELAREGAQGRPELPEQRRQGPGSRATRSSKLGGTCMLVKANLADPKEARAMVKQVAEQFGHLDVLVNNAGITRDKPAAAR